MDIFIDPAGGEPQNPLPETSLEALPPRLREACARAGWTSLLPVQAKAIPYLLAKRDMMVQARTGSGKTGAFLLPMLERLDTARGAAQALILVPTRELAKQVARDAETLCGEGGLRTVVLYGGVGYGPQLDGLRGGAHIVVGTPGRVLDHLLRRTLTLGNVTELVFDEGDRMLSVGFYPDMKQMQRYLPRTDYQACMFSATFPSAVLRIAREFLRNPEFLSLSRDHVHVTDTVHVVYNVPGMAKERSLVRILEAENPPSALIFCNTRDRVHFVSVVLQRFGYDADELSSDLSQADREKILERVRKGTLRFLVATDVASRGIDLPDLSHVILFEPPEDVEDYIHRAGRTGRAGAAGVALSLTDGVERVALDGIAKTYGIELQERTLPTDADVEAVVTERLTALVESRLRDRDKLQAERARRFLPLARSLAEADNGMDILAMLLDDSYQQAIHGPVPGANGMPPAEARERPGADRKRREGDRRGGSGGSRRRR